MTHFDTTNILDRLEKTWKIIFSSSWKTFIIPPILATIIWYSIATVSFIGGIAVLWNVYIWGLWLDTIRTLLVLFFILATVILGIYTYGYFVTYIYIASDQSKHGIPLVFKEIHEETFLKISSWFWYTLWFSLMLIWLSILFILGYFVFWNFWYTTAPIFIGIFFWLSVIYSVGMPGYVLWWKSSFHDFSETHHLTYGRWWRVFGNILGMWIIVAMAVNILQMPVWILVEPIINELDSLDGWSLENTQVFWFINILFTIFSFLVPFIYLLVIGMANLVFQKVFYYVIESEILQVQKTQE